MPSDSTLPASAPARRAPVRARLLGTVALAALAAAPACTREDRRPDILLVSIDSLRRDGLSSFGHPLGRVTSPNIDRLAQRGVRFTRAVSTTTWTLPSHHAMLRGVPDAVHGFVHDLGPGEVGGQPVAELLRDGGYQTFGVYSCPYLHPAFGFERGFDEYRSAMHYAPAYGEPGFEGLPPDAAAEKLLATQRHSHEDVTSEAVVEHCLEALAEREPDRPLFLFAHFFDVHFDYTPPPPYDREFDPDYQGPVDGRGVMAEDRIAAEMSARDLHHLRALYDGEVKWVDASVRRLIERIEQQERETVVVITSDHGDEFFEHGRFGHRNNLYQETLAIPIVLYSTGDTVPRDVTVDRQVRVFDVAATVLDVAGVARPDWMWGQSLLDLVSSPDAPHRPAPAGLNYQGEHRALLVHPLKIIGSSAPDGAVTWEAYDLGDDPGESKPLDSSRLEELGPESDRMLDRLEAARRSIPKQALGTDGVPDAMAQRLRSLGYVGDPSGGERLQPRYR